MKKEKNDKFDNDNIYRKLLKYLLETKTKGYEPFNIVTETGDSIFSPSFDELKSAKSSQIFISWDALMDFVREEPDKGRGESSKTT